MENPCYRVLRTLGAAALLAALAVGPAVAPRAQAWTPTAAPIAAAPAPSQGSGAACEPGREPAALSWHVETVDAAKAFRSMEDRSLALDAAGRPHIAYGDDSLYYAWHDGADWHYETVDTANDVGENAALGLDAQGRPHISYYDRWTGSLRYAFHDGTSWRIRVIDGIGSC